MTDYIAAGVFTAAAQSYSRCLFGWNSRCVDAATHRALQRGFWAMLAGYGFECSNEWMRALAK